MPVHLLSLQAACYVAAGHSALSACNSNSALGSRAAQSRSVPRTYTRTQHSDQTPPIIFIASS
eukprot:scaffold1735_cov119-Isochrysis_galbana.AAC.6